MILKSVRIPTTVTIPMTTKKFIDVILFFQCKFDSGTISWSGRLQHYHQCILNQNTTRTSQIYMIKWHQNGLWCIQMLVAWHFCSAYNARSPNYIRRQKINLGCHILKISYTLLLLITSKVYRGYLGQIISMKNCARIRGIWGSKIEKVLRDVRSE